MKRKQLSEHELVKGLTPHTAHADELAELTDKEIDEFWGAEPAIDYPEREQPEEQQRESIFEKTHAAEQD